MTNHADTPENDEAIEQDIKTPNEPQEKALESPDVETEVALIKEQLLRALAETENVRRRAAKDKEDALKYSISTFARELLTVADNLHRALANVTQEAFEKETADIKSLIEGVTMTEKELQSVFEKHGIKKISPMGEPFDHGFHQAMLEIESDEHPAGTVLQLMQAGYVLHDRLLRPALVGVAKSPSKGDSEN